MHFHEVTKKAFFLLKVQRQFGGKRFLFKNPLESYRFFLFLTMALYELMSTMKFEKVR